MNTRDRSMVTLSSFPFPPTKPKMLIKPKVFSITLRILKEVPRHVDRIKTCLQGQDMSPGQRRPCTLGDVEIILSSGPPTPTGPQRRRSLSDHYRERIEQTTEDKSIEHLSKTGTPSDRADSNSRGGERSDVLGKIVQNLQLASGEDSSSSQPREGHAIWRFYNRGRYWSRRFTTI